MTSAECEPLFSTAPSDLRSPFVRTAELLAGIAPGREPINLSVGEPQHPVPDFVGPVLAQHVAALGRYPLGKGTARFRAAAAGWLTRRYNLPRAPDPAWTRSRSYARAGRPRALSMSLAVPARTRPQTTTPVPSATASSGFGRSAPFLPRSFAK